MANLLTPAQFAQTAAAKKPGASYPAYRAYVMNTRKRRQAVREADPYWQATQMVDAQIKAGLAGDRAATAAAQTQAGHQAEIAQGYATALANLTQQNPADIKAGYQQAADRLSGYGTGLTGALADAYQKQADDTKARLAAVGAPDIAAGATLDPAGLRSTLQYTGVTMPATTLDQLGENAQQQAEFNRASQVQHIGDVAQQYLAKTQDLQSELAGKRAELEAQRPVLYQKAISDLQSQAQQQRALDIQEGTLQLQTAKTAADEAIAYTNITGTIHVVKNGTVVDTGIPAKGSTAYTHAATITAQNQRSAADRRVRQEIADAANQTRLTVAQTAADAKKAAADLAASGKTATAAQRSSILKNASAQAGDLVKKTTDRIWNLIPNAAPQGKKESDEKYAERHKIALQVYQQRKQEHRAEIVTRVTNLISGQLKLLGYTDAQIRNYADAVVSTYIPQG